MDFFKDVRTDYSMQVGLHKVKDHIEIFVVFSLDNIAQTNDVLVTIQFLQEHYFSESSLSVR